MANNVLLLGSNGLIGKYLSDNLNVIPISRKECDLEDYIQVNSLLKSIQPEVIINCSGKVNTQLSPFDEECVNVNLKIIQTLCDNKSYFGKLIDFGSGAEFDRSISISSVKEEELFERDPKDHYGFIKNLNSRKLRKYNDCYTLRLFGCLNSLDENRFFGRLTTSAELSFEDRYFDYFCVEDIVPVVQYFIENDHSYKDFNLVYKEKYKLSELASMFIEFHNLKTDIIYTESYKDYTGSSERLDSLKLNLKGIEQGLRDYKI